MAAGAKVITDDTFYLSQPFFQDGIVAQAVDRAKANGVAYLVSAGNRARQSWEGVFTPVGGLNDFDPGPGTDTRQTVATLPSGQSLTLTLQWDDPLGAVTNDYAHGRLRRQHERLPHDVQREQRSDRSPTEALSANGPISFAIEIRRVAGTGASHLKWIANGSFTGSVPCRVLRPPRRSTRMRPLRAAH